MGKKNPAKHYRQGYLKWQKWFDETIIYRGLPIQVAFNSGESNWINYRKVPFKIFLMPNFKKARIPPWWYETRAGFIDVGGRSPEDALDSAMSMIDTLFE
ncbi:MAG: hypothetical protein AAFO04_30070 [Cyanobacteria bacterium J06592_8]